MPILQSVMEGIWYYWEIDLAKYFATPMLVPVFDSQYTLIGVGDILCKLLLLYLFLLGET